MFLGSWRPSFDKTSRRLALPKKIRDYLATSQIILSYGFDRCVFGFDTKSWEAQSQKQLASPLSNRSARSIRRFIFATARVVNLDYQGRFVIPADLFGWAKIKNPTVIGAGDHFEIWDQRRWEEQKKRLVRM